MIPRPRYIHICPRCVFLGTWEDADLYACLTAGKVDTLIARHGEGSDYTSGIPFSYGTMPALTEARLRAGILGLDIPPSKNG